MLVVGEHRAACLQAYKQESFVFLFLNVDSVQSRDGKSAVCHSVLSGCRGPRLLDDPMDRTESTIAIQDMARR